MGRAERRALVRRAHPELSVSRQCRLLSVGRSSLYYTTRGESEETLALMRRIDALFLKHPFYGARQMVRHLRREGVRIGRRRAGRLMRLLGLQAIYRAPRLSAPHPAHRVYPYLLKGVNDRAGEPGLVRRHHLHPSALRVPVPRSDHGLGEPACAGLAAVEHPRRGLLRRSPRRRAGPPWPAGDLQHRPGQPVHERRLHRALAGRRHPDLDGRPGPIEDLLFRSPGRPSLKPLIRYKSFQYQADSWTTPRRVVAKVEHHVGELFPRVGFIVTNLPIHNRAVVRFYNKRGTAEQWIKEGKQATHWTRLSCHRFRANEVRLQLSVLAYNLGNLWRRLVLPTRIERWSLTSLQQRLVKTGWRLVKHARYYWLFLAESHLTRRLFGAMLQRIWALPVPAG